MFSKFLNTIGLWKKAKHADIKQSCYVKYCIVIYWKEEQNKEHFSAQSRSALSVIQNIEQVSTL